MPPIFQPEVAAEAILWAAQSSRREILVGSATVLTVLANRLVPDLLDRYLEKTNFDAQQYGREVDPNRPNNLWQPLPGDHGAHGTFDDRSQSFSKELWVSQNKEWLTAAGLGLAATALALWLLKRRK